MKKTVITFGLISGTISALMGLTAMPLLDKIGANQTEILGYTTIILSFLMVFVGIRSYRENAGHGEISFGRAFAVGILITLISCGCYVATWEVLYFNFSSVHSAMDKYAANLEDKAKASGASDAEIQAQLQQIVRFKELYQNPYYNSAITFLEPFPIGLVITLGSAGVLRRRRKTTRVAAALTSST
jgi:hypothetical protein